MSTMATANSTITFLGLGNMGTAVAQALAKSSHTVTVWNRTANRPGVSAAVTAGAVFEPSLAAAIKPSKAVVACVLDYTTLRSTLSQLDPGALAGKTFVNITNGTAKEALEMETWVRERLNVKTYLDGAVMVTPEMIETPHSLIVVSGETADAFSPVEGVLAPAGKALYLGPGVDAASRFDNAALAAMYGMFGGAFLGMALLKKGGDKGARETKVAPVVRDMIVPFLTALVPLVAREAEAWDEERFDDHGGNSLGMQHRGLMNIVQSLRDDGTDARFLEAWADVMERAIKDRGGEGGSSVLGTYLME